MRVILKVKNILLFLLAIYIISSNSYYSVLYAEETGFKKGEIKLTENELPKTNKIGHWFHSGKMKNKYIYHFSVLLPNGNVLIRGVKTAEIYNPKRNSYKQIEDVQPIDSNSLDKRRYKVMADGKFILFYIIPTTGGYSFEVFDYKTEKFEKFDDSYLPGPLPNTATLFLSSNKPYISDVGFLSDNLMLIRYNKKLYLYDYTKKIYNEVQCNNIELGMFNSLVFLGKIEDNIYFIKSLNRNIQLLKLDLSNLKFDITSIAYIEEWPIRPILINDNIYFFTNSVRVDSYKLRDKVKNSPVYLYNIKNNTFEKIGALYSAGAGSITSVLLKDGRILFNSGKFDGHYVQYEIFDPISKTSVFTKQRPWYKGCEMVLLQDGSVLKTGGWVIKQDSLYGTNNSEKYYP